MPWNSTVEAEYDALLSGVMGAALQGSASERQILKARIRAIETGGQAPDPLFAPTVMLMTPLQARSLWLWRVTYNFFTERNNWFPWRLRDKTVAELVPLLNFGWQGFTPATTVEYGMEMVWDDRPAKRVLEASMTMLFAALAGKRITTEVDLVDRIIQGMRNSGWKHVTGMWEDYASYPKRGSNSLNFDDIAAVSAGECHINSNYLVARLRSFNVPAHVARRWDTLSNGEPASVVKTRATEWHQWGHCFVHFPTIGSWLTHGDDVQDAILASIPPLFALKSELWMQNNHFGRTHYEWIRAMDYSRYTLWCLLVGRSPTRLDYDVPYLYRTGQLRGRLENVHVENNYAMRSGAPTPVPPLFTPAEVDRRLGWVAAKVP